jgi:hypothetical protein
MMWRLVTTRERYRRRTFEKRKRGLRQYSGMPPEPPEPKECASASDPDPEVQALVDTSAEWIARLRRGSGYDDATFRA